MSKELTFHWDGDNPDELYRFLRRNAPQWLHRVHVEIEGPDESFQTSGTLAIETSNTTVQYVPENTEITLRNGKFFAKGIEKEPAEYD